MKVLLTITYLLAAPFLITVTLRTTELISLRCLLLLLLFCFLIFSCWALVQQKIVLGVQMNCQKCRRKALEVVAETDGKC